jgi:hypothetical protein
MTAENVVSINGALSKKEEQAHRRWKVAQAARLRAEADLLEHPSLKNQRARDAALEEERTLGRAFRARVRDRVAAGEVE